MAELETDAGGRCPWATSDDLYIGYHDDEWGRPVVDDTRLFEKLCLEGFQAGLAWITILRKREAFRAGFAAFDPEVVAGFGEDDVTRLLADAGIVRHRGKIEAAISNAARYAELREEWGSLAAYAWSFEPSPTPPPPRALGDVPPTSPESTAMSKDLKKRGWRFVGPTTVYAFMQAMGLVDDHLVGCPSREVCEAERTALARPTRPT
jgi:DNA-3-methyladenine glycosylase I